MHELKSKLHTLNILEHDTQQRLHKMGVHEASDSMDEQAAAVATPQSPVPDVNKMASQDVQKIDNVDMLKSIKKTILARKDSIFQKIEDINIRQMEEEYDDSSDSEDEQEPEVTIDAKTPSTPMPSK